MQEAFGIVIFAVVGVSVVLAVVSLFFRGSIYDEIGRGGIGDDREIRPAAPSGAGRVDPGERDAEIRQMLERPQRPRTPPAARRQLDVEDELQRLTAPAADPALREEVRELVIARNAPPRGEGRAAARRRARGRAPAARVRRLNVHCVQDFIRSRRAAAADGPVMTFPRFRILFALLLVTLTGALVAPAASHAAARPRLVRHRRQEAAQARSPQGRQCPQGVARQAQPRQAPRTPADARPLPGQAGRPDKLRRQAPQGRAPASPPPAR